MKFTKMILVFSVTLLVGLLTACNTVRGAGEDLTAGGKALTQSAERSGASGK